MHLGMKRILVATLTALACSKADAPARDAGAERVVSDTAVSPSDVSVALKVDFTVENCPAFDPQAITCTGQVPLTVRFVPLATTTVIQYYWNFGDGSPFALEVAPSHPYTVPGVYTVSVVATGVDGNMVSQAHPGYIVVLANPLGDPCDSDLQCNQGLFCLCSTKAPCSTGPTSGLCASSCQVDACDDTAVCAGLLTAAPPTGEASPWQNSLCLRACAKDDDCAAGLSCRTLPLGGADGGWTHGCFVSVPGDVGEPCRDVEGNLRNDLCTSGFCADLGAKGLCSLDCANATCPPGSDCAVLGDGRNLCLRPCTNFNCAQDPLLTCVVPNPGDLGYQLTGVAGPNAASSYCAPKPCSVDDPSGDGCLPTGTCVTMSGAGHCVKRSN
jgi:PKD repeat protein